MTRNMNHRNTVRWTSLHFLLTASVALSFACNAMAQETNTVQTLKKETIKIDDAPFDMPDIVVPDFSGCPKFPITDFGAKAGNPKSVSEAIAEAIDKANEAGGGIVVVPRGDWKTKGPVHLKSNVNLQLDEGCKLTFSPDPEDYLPAVQSSFEGAECYNYSPLIYAFECTNVAVTGSGKVVADMSVWRSWQGRPEPHKQATIKLYYMVMDDVPVEERDMTKIRESNMRPQFIQFNRCEGVLLDGISINYSPLWCIHLFLSKDIVVRNVSVWAQEHNNDGIDPEMSQNVLIENCTFEPGDDTMAIKAGRNRDGWRLHTPSKNIVMRNCTAKRAKAHEFVAIGSELSGGVENVLIENCETEGASFHVLYIKTNERRGGFVKNIHMRNIKAGWFGLGVLGIQTDVLYQWKDWVKTIEKKTTPISDIYLENIQVEYAKKYITLIEGQPMEPVENVVLKNIAVDQVDSEEEWWFRNKNVNNFDYTKAEPAAETVKAAEEEAAAEKSRVPGVEKIKAVNEKTVSGSGDDSVTIRGFDMKDGNALVVLVSGEGPDSAPSYSVKFSGSSVKSTAFVQEGKQGAAVFAQIDPSSSKGDVVVTFDGDSTYAVSVLSLSDVADVNSTDSFGEPNTPQKLTYKGTAGGYVVAAMADNTYNGGAAATISGDNIDTYVQQIAGTKSVSAGLVHACGIVPSDGNFTETFKQGKGLSDRNAGVLVSFDAR